MNDDRRLIEDYLPIEAISAEASREKSVRKGHISTLHLWWARRPLVACRAAVYGALVPASRFRPANGPEDLPAPPACAVGTADRQSEAARQAGKRDSLTRANAAKFVEQLCQYPGAPQAIAEAQKHILEAHAERLSTVTGLPVSVEDIVEGRAPRPKVLDMFAGGGAIPLEALRLGCEAYALDLNPVAHIIELCTLVYPQKYGKPDPGARGMTGPKNAKGDLPAAPGAGTAQAGTTWGGLAEEVRYWGEWVLERVKAEIGDLYPLIPDPKFKGKETGGTGFPACAQQLELFITRRNLPHWQLQGSTYFVTFRLKAGVLSPAERQIVLDAIKHFHDERYWVIAAAIMPDHVHIVLRPAKDTSGADIPLGKVMQSIKGYTARRINECRAQRGTLWLDESFDRIIRDQDELLEKRQYVRNNPVKAGLCEKPEGYPFLWEPGDAQEPQARKPVTPIQKVPAGYLVPVAYLWTRTVRCKNPTCGATVPLVRQTWLCRKKDRFVALKMVAPKGKKNVRFEVVEAASEHGLGFDPAGFSKGGNATCPFCGTVADSDYVKAEGCAKRMGQQMMAIVCTRPGRQGKVYLSADDYPEFRPDDEAIRKRIEALCQRTGLTVPSELIVTDAKNSCWTRLYGLSTFGDLFTPRQMLCLLSFAAAVREAEGEMRAHVYEQERIIAVVSHLALYLDRGADHWATLCAWNPIGEKLQHTFGRQALPMVWDYSEANPFGGSVGDWLALVLNAENGIWAGTSSGELPATVSRGSATALPWPNASFDAVITDPPYYDNVPYADISDFFYVWLKRTIGHLYPEHFATDGTPKKNEAVADAVRHGGSKEKARQAYEQMMAQSFAEANRVLKPGGQMVVVYAHRTTLGWSTLVDALRQAGFTVMEAWPLDTEMKSRLRGMDSAALASSIFLVARKREGDGTGSYEDEVRPELERIVRERVDSLWKMGITGADLVIAAVGAGLRAFTRFARVEYANGEEVPAEKFLAEVEGVVLETLLEKIFVGQASSLSNTGQRPVPLGSVDGPSRFYVLWRYTYKAAEMDAGEAIVFTYGQNVELDLPAPRSKAARQSGGHRGLATGRNPLVEKKKGKYRLRDFTERGEDDKLGLPADLPAAAGAAQAGGGAPAPLIDALHRILWLVENQPRALNKFLDEARPDRERLRLVAQVLAGTALAGKKDNGPEHLPAPRLRQAGTVATTAAEQAALKKLVANWRALIDQRLAAGEGTLFDRSIGDKKHGTSGHRQTLDSNLREGRGGCS